MLLQKSRPIRLVRSAVHFLAALLPLVTPATGTGTDLALARPFASHMVLPMKCEIPVWGVAPPGTDVQLQLNDATHRTTANRQGYWRIPLPAMEPSAKPASMTIEAAGTKLQLDDLLVGRVFLCSGQSNMDFQLSRAIGGIGEAKESGRFPSIRLCNLTGVPTDSRVYDATTLARLNDHDHFTGTWERATEESASAFSAIAWWTGKMIHEREGEPVGLVENAIGGSGTEAWLPRNLLSSQPAYTGLLAKEWLTSPKVSPWARSRAKENLGQHPEANHPFKPGFLFESGVRPWCGFPFDSVIWYQGETNAEIADDKWNRHLIADLITGWRKELGQDKLPFYLVQLPRIGGNEPIRGHWPEYRKVQADVARTLPAVQLVVTQDLGWNSSDVHPPDKLPVAKRLAEAIPPK